MIVSLLLLQAIGNLYLPTLNADLINNGVIRSDLAYVWRAGQQMLLVVIAIAVVSFAGVWLSSRVAMAVGRDLRKEVFDSVLDFAEDEFANFGSASLITRNTNDVQQILNFVQVALTVMVLAPIQAIGGIFMAMRQDLRLSTLLAVAVPLLAVVIGVVMARAVPLFRTLQVRIDAVNRVLREQITGIRVIRAFAREDFETQRFEKVNRDLTSNALGVNRLFVVAMPAMMLILNISTVSVIWFGGHLVERGQLQIGTLSAFLSYIMQILVSVLMAVMVIILVPRASASAERIAAVLAVVPSISDPVNAVVPGQPRGGVEFRSVSYRYPGAADAVVADISLLIEAGCFTAIVGSTGSGKTTLLNLIPRLTDASTGLVLVDGIDVRQQGRNALWFGIGLVPQRPYLFAGTVADNVRLGADSASDEDVWWALEVAQARDFVVELPGQLQANVSQGGGNFSGGQRQRLAIARAVVRRPRLYLFDDSFASLDAQTDANLRAALLRELSGSTVVVVAQRISTILDADRIVVLEAGRVVGVGTHGELLELSAVYQEIVVSQLGPVARS